MRVNVPNTLSGGSLLNAHKWVKSQMARTNPGGSADYTLRSIDGSSLTLSDLTRSNPNPIEVEIVMAGVGGVRSNPRGIPIPTDFSSSPSFPRTGNFTSALLPQNLDPQLVERMVAQEGLFGAVQTLTILLSERSPMESMSPTTAGLLYAHSAIPRKNPSVKTPFLSDVPKEMMDSDIRMMRYLSEKGIVDYETIETAEGMVDSAKVSAKYGLTGRQLNTFIDDVLAPFMAVAPANRGALRHINKKLTALKSSKSKENYSAAYAKLMEMMPSKAEDFYHGRDYGLIASPHCVYPILAEKVLPPGAVKELLKVASEYPDNLTAIKDAKGATRMGLKLSKKQAKLISHRVTSPSWLNRLRNIFRPGRINLDDSFQAKVDLIRGVKENDEQYIELIMDAINAPGIVDTVKKDTQKIIFAPNIGGFFPSPPNKWPQQVVYAVMDTLLQSIPEIVDIEKPENNYESTVYRLLHSPQNSLDNIWIGSKKIPKADIEKAMTIPADRDALVDELQHEFKFDAAKELVLKGSSTEFLIFITENCVETDIGFIDPKYGKSIFELLFETIETAKGKYGYDIVDDDITFALILLDYSIKKLFDDGTIADGGNAASVSLGGLFGARNTKKFTEQAKYILKTKGATDKGEVAIIVHLGALSAFVDALVAETTDATTKAANVAQLKSFTTTYGTNLAPGIRAVGSSILSDGKRRLDAVVV